MRRREGAGDRVHPWERLLGGHGAHTSQPVSHGDRTRGTYIHAAHNRWDGNGCVVQVTMSVVRLPCSLLSGAYFLERLAERFTEHYANGNHRACSNLMLIFSHMYNFQV